MVLVGNVLVYELLLGQVGGIFVPCKPTVGICGICYVCVYIIDYMRGYVCAVSLMWAVCDCCETGLSLCGCHGMFDFVMSLPWGLCDSHQPCGDVISSIRGTQPYIYLVWVYMHPT